MPNKRKKIISKEQLEENLETHFSEDGTVKGIPLTVKKRIFAKKNYGKYIKKGDKCVELYSEEGIHVLMKNSMSSAYHNSGFFKNRNAVAIVVDKVDDNTYVVSGRDYQRLYQKPILAEIAANDNMFIGRVVGFEEGGAILKYRGVHFNLSNKNFSENKGSVSVEDVFKIGDYIPVKFDSARKNGRILRVLPLVKFPKPIYAQTHQLDDFKPDTEYIGKVIGTSPKHITVLVGTKDLPAPKFGDKYVSSDIVLIAPHPINKIDEFIIPGVTVNVQVNVITKDVLLGYVNGLIPFDRGILLSQYITELDNAGYLKKLSTLLGANNDKLLAN